jgi:hypothetical protein
MSTKRIFITVATGLALVALSATTAFARPDPAASSPVIATATAGQSHLPAGHHAASGAAGAPRLAVAKPERSSSDGVPAATVFALMALALLAGAMIAIWAAARTGHVTRERTASR